MHRNRKPNLTGNEFGANLFLLGILKREIKSTVTGNQIHFAVVFVVTIAEIIGLGQIPVAFNACFNNDIGVID